MSIKDKSGRLFSLLRRFYVCAISFVDIVVNAFHHFGVRKPTIDDFLGEPDPVGSKN